MPFEPKNDLERSLVKASSDPAHRPQFYRDFLAADIFVIQHGAHLPKSGGEFAMKPTDTVQLGRLQIGAKFFIPLFTSLEALITLSSGSQNYLRLNTRDFFVMTRGNALFLNPGSEVGKEITVAEVEQFLDGTLGSPAT